MQYPPSGISRKKHFHPECSDIKCAISADVRIDDSNYWPPHINLAGSDSRR